jgi:hypothetical protein
VLLASALLNLACGDDGGGGRWRLSGEPDAPCEQADDCLSGNCNGSTCL